jgi:hypothetical protein
MCKTQIQREIPKDQMQVAGEIIRQHRQMQGDSPLITLPPGKQGGKVHREGSQ